MESKINEDVSGTAFVVNYSRARMEDLSKDVYAKLWVNQEVIALWNDLAKNVYPNDDLNISLRNRFNLEQINEFIKINDNPVIINIAAGFGNYPFLTDKNSRFIEIDLPNIVEYKKNKIGQFIEENKLPDRKIEFLAVDLKDAKQREIMKHFLKDVTSGNPALVTMEGITYYLEEDILADIFKTMNEILTKGSLVVFDYWKPDTMEYPVMIKLKEYLDKIFGYTDSKYYLFDDIFIKSINGFEEILSVDIAGLELKYSETSLFQTRDNKIPAYFSVMNKL